MNPPDNPEGGIVAMPPSPKPPERVPDNEQDGRVVAAQPDASPHANVPSHSSEPGDSGTEVKGEAEERGARPGASPDTAGVLPGWTLFDPETEGKFTFSGPASRMPTWPVTSGQVVSRRHCSKQMRKHR